MLHVSNNEYRWDLVSKGKIDVVKLLALNEVNQETNLCFKFAATWF